MNTLLKKALIHNLLPVLLVAAIAWFAAPALTRGDSLAKPDAAFLASYEKVRAALIGDDLALAKKSAALLGEPGSRLAASSTLAEARASFAELSKTAIKLAAGQPGYYIFHCPMANLDWVQTTREVSNPYGGAEMRLCGELRK